MYRLSNFLCSSPKSIEWVMFFASRKRKKLVTCESNAPEACTGVDVMITIFCDFWQFSAKQIGVFLKNQCYDQNVAYFSFVLSKNNANFFAKFFCKNIFKIITSVPGGFVSAWGDRSWCRGFEYRC
jgi:hypothetical protein